VTQTSFLSCLFYRRRKNILAATCLKCVQKKAYEGKRIRLKALKFMSLGFDV
jgi:hypothetical protein